MSMKQLLIMAIVRHLRASDYCEKNAGIYNNGVISCNNKGLKSIAERMDSLRIRFEKRASNHRECAAVLTLLICPPLFYSALDLKNGGKADRFVESGL